MFIRYTERDSTEAGLVVAFFVFKGIEYSALLSQFEWFLAIGII